MYVPAAILAADKIFIVTTFAEVMAQSYITFSPDDTSYTDTLTLELFKLCVTVQVHKPLVAVNAGLVALYTFAANALAIYKQALKDLGAI